MLSISNVIKDPSPQATDDCVDLLRALQQLARARRRSMRQHPDASGLMVLSALDGCADGMRISNLAELVMLDVSAASRRIAALEAAGLLDRVPDPVDHRAQLVRLTEDGRSTLAEAVRATGTDLAGRMTGWSDTDIRTLTGLARRLAGDLVASEPGCTRSPARVRQLVTADTARPD
jgi:DNA-binding MarR family transcriptional regulator